jgi:hypothetical protein
MRVNARSMAAESRIMVALGIKKQESLGKIRG